MASLIVLGCSEVLRSNHFFDLVNLPHACVDITVFADQKLNISHSLIPIDAV